MVWEKSCYLMSNFSTFPKRSQADIFMMIHTWTMPPELLAFVGGQIGILRRGPSALWQVVPRCLDGAIVLFGREFNTIPLLNRENRNSSSNIFWVASMENSRSICCFPHLHHYMSVHFALEDKTEQIKLILRKTVETKQKYIPTDSKRCARLLSDEMPWCLFIWRWLNTSLNIYIFSCTLYPSPYFICTFSS